MPGSSTIGTIAANSPSGTLILRISPGPGSWGSSSPGIDPSRKARARKPGANPEPPSSGEAPAGSPVTGPFGLEQEQGSITALKARAGPRPRPGDRHGPGITA